MIALIVISNNSHVTLFDGVSRQENNNEILEYQYFFSSPLLYSYSESLFVILV